MISGRLVHLIETHAEQIIDRLVAQIRGDPEMTHTRSLFDHELRDWGLELLRRLGVWLASGSERELAIRYQRLGKFCVDEEIPLHETVRRLALLREKMLDFTEEQKVSNGSLELYAEEELVRRLGRLFDFLVVNLIRGYEHALRRDSVSRMATH